MIKPNNKKELEQIILERIRNIGYDCDLNDINVSLITDMSYLFDDTPFNGDISEWDVSGVENMRAMFAESEFNGDISKWNVGNVTNKKFAFKKCPIEYKEEMQPKFKK